MVLKRLLMTALGALSLSALAAGPASAQQIPAPDAYGDPQACAAQVKEAKAVVDKGEVQDNGLTPMQEAALTNMARACAPEGGDAVGGGIARARTLYQTAMDAAAELKAAEKAYEDDDSARNMEKRDEAKTAHDTAVAARNAYSGGPDSGTIYEAVYAEEGRRAAATAANSAWDTARMAAETAEMTRDMVEVVDYVTTFAGFDATGQAYVFETFRVVDTPATESAEATYTTHLRVRKQGGGYVEPVRSDLEDPESDLVAPSLTLTGMNLDGTNGTAISWEYVNGIDDAGVDHDDNDATDPIRYVRVSNGNSFFVEDDVTTIGGENGVNADYMMAKMTLETAEEALKGNQDGNLTIGLTEDVRKAQARYDFFAAQKASIEKALAAGKLKVDRGLGDNPDQDGVQTDFPLGSTLYTVEEYEALTDLQDAAGDAADALKAAYDARVAASDDVEANQRDTQKYLEQLVLLRQGEKAAADAAAIKAEAEEETAGQKTANEALATAEAQLATYGELQALSDDNPVKALVTSLLEPDGDAGDDDGQALVDAIGATYETANDAMTLVEGLGGPDGSVAQNTAKNVEQDEKLLQKKMYIDNLAAEIGVDPVTGEGTEANGMSRIDNNETRSMANETEIGMDADGMSRIDHNETRSMANTAEIAVDADGMSRIDHNETRSMGNATAVEMLGGRVGTNETAISGLGTRVGANESAIMDNRNRIGELSDDLDIVRSGVAASMALAGMPAINGRGIAIGVGSFDGESAFAVGFQIQGEMASFQIGVTSSGGETGASAGVGFQF